MTNCRRVGWGCEEKEEAAANEGVHFSLSLLLSLPLSLSLFLCYVNSLDGWSARSNLSVDTKRSRTHSYTATVAAYKHKHTHIHYTTLRKHTHTQTRQTMKINIRICTFWTLENFQHLHFLKFQFFLALAQIVVYFFLWSISIIFPWVNFPPLKTIYIERERAHTCGTCCCRCCTRF